MGIQGLLPLLKPIHKEVHLSQFAGQTIGVDTYCWLHKGAYGCAMDIVEGKKTQVYLNYIIKRLDMMLYNNVKPYLVLDGGHLPSKANKEAERRKSRQDNKAKGLALLRAGNKTQAYECFQKCVDITPEMALDVIKVCRERNIDYIVAPYEADSQLAYLMKTGITQATISEDSDLLVYGCNKVIFKMDEFGSGTLVDLADLPRLKDLKMHEFTQEKFRHMCILSGCDYLPSIKGIGLKTANKLIRKHSTIDKLVRSIRLENKLKVPVDYEKNFKQADETFLYQLVFDPSKVSLVPLTPLPNGMLPGQLEFAGPLLSNDKAHAVALGNINPITHQVMDSYDPTTNKQIDEPDESKTEKSACAFSFSNKSTSRQSLTPSTLLNSSQSHTRDEPRNTAADKCRRFLLPPLNKKAKEKDNTSDDKDIMKLYTFLKPKTSTADRKPNRSSTCGLSRKRKIKNPFRMDHDDDTIATQQSSYFSSTVDTKVETKKMDDCDRTNTPNMPLLPTWCRSEHQSPSGDNEEQKENSPSDSTSFNFPQRSASPGKVLSNALNSNVKVEDFTIEHNDPKTSYNNTADDRSLSTTSKHFKLVKAQNEPRTASYDKPSVATPLKGLNKFVYKPKGKSIEDKDLVLNSASQDSAEGLDSGYISDGEETTDVDTPPERQKDYDKVVSRPINRPIQLKAGTSKRTGLSRCKSLGISKRKSSAVKPAVTSANTTLFSYFEYKNKRPRLDTS